MQYEHNFRVGDRVIAIEAVDGKWELVGKSGTVIYLMGSTVVSVDFDEPFRGGHSESGRGRAGHCHHGHYSSFDFEPTGMPEIDISISFESLPK